MYYNIHVGVMYSNILWYGAVISQGCHGQGKTSGKRFFFPGQEKLGNYVNGQGNLERTLKVREMSGNLKINGYYSLQKL